MAMANVDFMKTEGKDVVDPAPGCGSRQGVTVLLRCPPYCRSNCVMQHHPLLVALLNCIDTDDKVKMEARMRDLRTVVKQYRDVMFHISVFNFITQL